MSDQYQQWRQSLHASAIGDATGTALLIGAIALFLIVAGIAHIRSETNKPGGDPAGAILSFIGLVVGLIAVGGAIWWQALPN